MRTKHTIINIFAGLGNQLIITSLSFISRTVFINTLNIEYLGINGLFTSILAMISLAEAGIGSSIVYNLYKPVADNDQTKINALMRLYKNAYIVIAFIVLLLGLSIMPFLDFFVKNTHVEHISLIYLIFLVNTVAPYFFVYKNSFLNVCQKSYIVTIVFTVSSVVSTCLKVGVLYYTGNFIYYLVIESIITIAGSIVLSVIVDRMYPFLRVKTAAKIEPETKAGMIKNIKAIVLQNIGGYFVFGAESIIISSFVSLAAVGLYSNYKMLIDICRTFINQVFSNMYHSIGNLVAKESRDKIYSVYKGTMLLNFWLYSLVTIALYVVVEPFITLWIGPKFLMSQSVLIVLMLMFFERGMRNSITTVKTTAGIFHEDRFAPLCQAVLNLVISIVLVRQFGLIGVFIGGLISSIAVPFWLTPYLVYKKVFEQPVSKYFLRYMYYAAAGVGTCFLTSFLCNLIVPHHLWLLVARGIVGLAVPNLIYVGLFYKTEEFRYLLAAVQTVAGSLLRTGSRVKKLQAGEKVS